MSNRTLSTNTHDESREQISLIRETAAAVADRENLSRVRSLRFTLPGFDSSAYRKMAEQGWIGLALAEDQGGAGFGIAEYVALCEELGVGLVPEPFIGADMAARLAGSRHRDAIIDGSLIVLPAYEENEEVAADYYDQTVFQSGKVTGEKKSIYMAGGADAFIISSKDGLCLVRADATGVELQTEFTQDGGHFGTLKLQGAPAELLQADSNEAFDVAALGVAAYLLGIIEASLAKTKAYLGMRKQFGVTISSFQALRHKVVDLSVQAALARASIDNAVSIVSGDATARQKATVVSRAKIRAADAAMLVTRQSVQMHGAIGFTDEADIGLYLRKAMVMVTQFGSTKFHRRRYADLFGATQNNVENHA